MDVQAIQRDLKDYIAKHSDRQIPVGYSAADVRDVLEDTWNYVSCEIEDSPSSRADFFGLNSYSWCGDASYKSSGYDKLVDMFSETPNPVFFSEYGCNEVTPRVFSEVETLYSEKMTKSMCGGMIYEYTQEANKYGMVTINKNDTTTLMVDYENLMKQYKKLDMKKLQSLDASGSKVKPPKCKSSLIKSDKFQSKFDIPKLPKGGADLIKKGISDANNGKLVKVEDTKVKSTVYSKDGEEIKGLELKVLSDDASNAPGENTSGKGGSSGVSKSDDDEDSDDKNGASIKSTGAGFACVLAILTASAMMFA